MKKVHYYWHSNRLRQQENAHTLDFFDSIFIAPPLSRSLKN